MTIHRVRVQFFSPAIVVKLSGLEETVDNDRQALTLEISCKPLDWQLSALSQVLASFLSSLPTLDRLEIGVYHEDWQGKIDVIQWQEFLLQFTSVKDMTLEFEDSVRLIAPALQDLARETAIEVLPALKNIFLGIDGCQPSVSDKEAIEQFIATREIYSHPVTVHY